MIGVSLGPGKTLNVSFRSLNTRNDLFRLPEASAKQGGGLRGLKTKMNKNISVPRKNQAKDGTLDKVHQEDDSE